MRLRIASAAEDDIYELHVYGAVTYGVPQADRYVDQLRELLELLCTFPQLARERDETRPPVRVYPYMGHNIVYRLVEDEVHVMRVLHHSANWMAVL